MAVAAAPKHAPPGVRTLAHAPAELTSARLCRLGEGIGKVVYASEHWVVKRERSPREILALILIWKALRRVSHLLPPRIAEHLLGGPSKTIRLLRVFVQATALVVPRSVWFATHAGAVWKTYIRRGRRGERLARTKLAGTPLVPERITFPPIEVIIHGWPGWLRVCEAVERVEETLDQRLRKLAEAGAFSQLELWLDRFLALREAGWQRGVFSMDVHLKNFGVCGERIVLLDSGGLTTSWSEIEDRLQHEDAVEEPHLQLGLGPVLESRPDIAARFDARWKAIVNPENVLRRWPDRLGA